MPDAPLWTRSALIREARTWLNTPHHHGAHLKGVGTDCLGLLRGLWETIYGEASPQPPPYSPYWDRLGDGECDDLWVGLSRYFSEIPLGTEQPGDILVFRWREHLPCKHVGLLTSPKTLLHVQAGYHVCEIPLTPWWERHCAGSFMFQGVKEERGC